MRSLSTFTFLSILAASGPARAEDADATGSHPVAPEPHARTSASHPSAAEAVPPETDGAAPIARRWYGWQSLTVDAAAVSVMIAGLGISTTKGDAGQLMAYGAFGGYLIGGPITHFAHGSTTRGFGSFAIRAAAPAGFAVMGSQLDVCGRQEEICTLGGAAVGMAVAIAVDAALLGYEKVPVQTRGLARLGISVDREHMAIVAGGTF